jgi:hypothetical protein
VKVSLRVSTGSLAAATKATNSREWQTRAAGNERTRVAGALAPSAGTSQERVGLREPDQITDFLAR